MIIRKSISLGIFKLKCPVCKKFFKTNKEYDNLNCSKCKSGYEEYRKVVFLLFGRIPFWVCWMEVEKAYGEDKL